MRTRTRIATLAYVVVTGISLPLTTGCSSASYWIHHPDEIRLSTVQYTSEPIFDSIRTLPQPASVYEIQILVQNDSTHRIKFSKYVDGAWVGEGLRASVNFRAAEPVIAAVTFDYARLSGLTVWGGDDSHNRRPLLVQIAPASGSFSMDQLRSIGAAIDVTFTFHDKYGNPVSTPKTANIATELLLIGKIAPRRSTVVAR